MKTTDRKRIRRNDLMHLAETITDLMYRRGYDAACDVAKPECYITIGSKTYTVRVAER